MLLIIRSRDMSKKFSLLFKLLALILAIGLLSCKSEKSMNGHRFRSLEVHRQIAIKEKLEEAGYPDYYKKLFYKTKYTIPDSITGSDFLIGYINENLDLPDFIAEALIEGEVVEMMTIGEFYLAKPDLLKETMIVSSVSDPHILIIGYKEYFNSERNAILGGSVWMFKNGFFWESGQI